MAKSEQTENNSRVPIIAVMGHVDHGKTSLLDVIRGTHVQSGEAGGITQNTRAHKVQTKSGRFMTFIDTPGHEAFSEMRSRGARVADVVMLVVAADDGVQPQTKESIEFIKRSNLPVVIACNKMDLPGANPDKVKQELSQVGILVEEYGGEAVLVPVSAKKEQGIDELLDALLLVTDMQELKPQKAVQGTAEAFVLESNKDTDLGVVAMVILKTGTVSKGQYAVADGKVHKIRETLNEYRKPVQNTTQGDPVWLIGLEEVLPIGVNLLFFNTVKEAQEAAAKMVESKEAKEADLVTELEDSALFAELLGAKEDRQDRETQLSVILKADTKGTLDAIETKLKELSFQDAKVSVFRAETGNITAGDVQTAHDTSGIVLGFQVKLDSQAEVLARKERVLVRTYEIIYDLIDEVEAVVHSMITPEEQRVEVARAHIKQIFELTNGQKVAGCEVLSGNVIKGYQVYVERKGESLGEGKITSLRKGKDEVKDVKKGMDCGIMIEPVIEFETGDDIVCFKIEKV
jgi:translation initiation factor IF-2